MSKVQAKLEEKVEQRLRIEDLPASRNWAVSGASAAVYRSLEVQALVELLEVRAWRPEDICTALSLACFKDTAEPILLQVFDQREMWYLRTGWMRAVHLELETEGKWSPANTVLVKVAGPFSEGQLELLHHHLGSVYHPDIDRHKRADLLANPFDETDIVKVPRAIACRWRWVALFQAAKRALNVETDESGTVAVRSFRTLAIDIFQTDSASGSITSRIGQSAQHPLCLTLMLDGFPLDKQSIEHFCLANSSLHDGVALHSEAALRCGVVAGMKETNSGFAKVFEKAGVGDDLNAIASGSLCLPSTQTLYTSLAIGADRKAIENLRGCGPCSPWCEKCDRAVQHVLPWARNAHPPATMAEYRKRKSHLALVTRKGGQREWVGCSSSFLTNADIREAGHVPQQGEALPRFCRWCKRVPYASVQAMQAAKARMLALKLSPNKKDRNTHDRERSTYAAAHAHQHEFSYLWLNLDMDAVVPEWMHNLDLNLAYLFFKHVTLKHCDPFTREWVAHFHTGLGAKLDTTKKKSGRAGDRWHKASVWCELAEGSAKFTGGMRCWYPCLVLLIGDCMLDSVSQGGEHSSAEPSAIAAPAPAPCRYSVRVDTDSDDDAPPRRPPRPTQPTPPVSRDQTLSELMEAQYGNANTKTLLGMLDGNEAYLQFHHHSHLPCPSAVSVFSDPSTHQDEADAFALKFAVKAVDAFHYIEDSNPDHKSWMLHIGWAVMPEFLARGMSWQYCTGKLEARGAAAKRVGRTTVCWRRQTAAADRRSISKKSNAKSRKEGTPRTGESAPFTQRYKSSGHRQLLENIGLRESMLRSGVSRKSRKLSQMGRVTAARKTEKWESQELGASHACPFTMRQMFEYMYRGRFGRLYDVHGKKQPAAWDAYIEIARDEGS